MAEQQGAAREQVENGPNAGDILNINRQPVAGIRPPQPLVIDANVAENWKLFRQKWTHFSIISCVNTRDVQYQTALLLHTLGDDALRVYNGFQFATPDDARTPDDILQAFDTFAVGEKNITYERYVFNMRKQSDTESVDAYIAALCTLIKSCNYCQTCVTSILRDQIVLGVKNKENLTVEQRTGDQEVWGSISDTGHE